MVEINTRQELDDLLQDESIKTLAIVRGADAEAASLASRIDVRTKGMSWREVGLVRSTGVLTTQEKQSWFGTGAVAVVLASVTAGRPPVGAIPADASFTDIEMMLLRSDSVMVGQP